MSTFTDCIEWEGATLRGYPVRDGKHAHRRRYEAAGLTIPIGHVLHHLCANKLCVNVAHLVPLTPRAHMLLHRSWERSAAARVAKTHCLRGHPLADAKVFPNGKRQCMACVYQLRRERRERQAMMLAEQVDEQPAEPLDPLPEPEA